MTSSATSTERGGPPAIVPKPGPPARQLVRRWVVPAVAVVPAIAFAFGLYGPGLSVAALFLALAWVSLVLAGWQMYRAAVALDDGDLSAHDTELSEDHRLDLEREKKLLLKAIKEAEFDHAMGKMDDDDASHVNAGYRRRALEIMRELERDKPRDLDVVIEKEVARRLAKSGVDVAALPAPAVAAVAVGVCPECATGNDADAVFCKKCGGKLGAP